MYIDRIFQTVKALINTENRGNFNPARFDLILYNSMQERYVDYLYEVNQMVNRENRGLINGGLENIPERIREKLLHYLVSETISVNDSAFTLPADLRYFDTIVNSSTGNKEEVFEFCKDMQEFNALKSTLATKQYPICIKVGNVIKTAPNTFDSVDIFYLRNPKKPKWTYTVFGGSELFNPSALDFQDVDMHPSEEYELTRLVCFKFGINLKEQDIQAVMQNEENIKFNQNNAS